MNLHDLQKNWNRFGKQDPLWAILSDPNMKGGKWAPKQFFHTGKDNISEFFEYLSDIRVAIPRLHALDFGCGVGRLTQALAPNFDNVAGVDIAPSMIKLAQQHNRFEGRCRYYLNERDDLALFKDASFDLVFSILVLQHIHPQYVRRYLAEFLRVLAPRGVLYFQLPSRYLGGEDTQVAMDKYRENISRGHRVRTLVKNVTPQPLQQLYRTVRDWNKEPMMEMYGIERSEVESVLKAHGGVLLDVVEKRHTLSKWESFCYCVTKP